MSSLVKIIRIFFLLVMPAARSAMCVRAPPSGIPDSVFWRSLPLFVFTCLRRRGWGRGRFQGEAWVCLLRLPNLALSKRPTKFTSRFCLQGHQNGGQEPGKRWGLGTWAGGACRPGNSAASSLRWLMEEVSRKGEGPSWFPSARVQSCGVQDKDNCGMKAKSTVESFPPVVFRWPLALPLQSFCFLSSNDLKKGRLNSKSRGNSFFDCWTYFLHLLQARKSA